MAELRTRVSLDNITFMAKLNEIESRLAQFGRRAGSAGEEAGVGYSRGLSKIAGHLAGLDRTGFMAISGITQAVEEAGGSWSRFGAIIGNSALYGGAAIGIGLVINKAMDLNKEIQELQKNAGQPVKGFWENWADGWSEMVDRMQRKPINEVLNTSEEEKQGAKEKILPALMRNAKESMRERTWEDDFRDWMANNIKTGAAGKTGQDYRAVAKEMRDLEAARKESADLEKQQIAAGKEAQSAQQRLSDLEKEQSARRTMLANWRSQHMSASEYQRIQNSITAGAIEEAKLRKQVADEQRRATEESQRADASRVEKEYDAADALHKQLVENSLIGKSKEEQIRLLGIEENRIRSNAKTAGTGSETGMKLLKEAEEIRGKALRLAPEKTERRVMDFSKLIDQGIGTTVGEAGGVFARQFGRGTIRLGQNGTEHVTGARREAELMRSLVSQSAQSNKYLKTISEKTGKGVVS